MAFAQSSIGEHGAGIGTIAVAGVALYLLRGRAVEMGWNLAVEFTAYTIVLILLVIAADYIYVD